METKYYEGRRIRHAAHTGNGTGWDLEQITIRSEERERDTLDGGFKYHSGYVVDGQQYWIYYRHAPLSSGTCDNCPAGVNS